MSPRTARKTSLAISKGAARGAFAGPVQEGKLDWEGKILLSEDTKFEGRGLMGMALSPLAGMMAGKKIEGFLVRGTLDHPEIIPPTVLAGPTWKMIQSIFFEESCTWFK